MTNRSTVVLKKNTSYQLFINCFISALVIGQPVLIHTLPDVATSMAIEIETEAQEEKAENKLNHIIHHTSDSDFGDLIFDMSYKAFVQKQHINPLKEVADIPPEIFSLI